MRYNLVILAAGPASDLALGLATRSFFASFVLCLCSAFATLADWTCTPRVSKRTAASARGWHHPTRLCKTGRGLATFSPCHYASYETIFAIVTAWRCIGVSSLTTFATHWIRCRGHQRSGGQMLGHGCAKCKVRKVLVLLSNPSVTICYGKPTSPHPIPKQHIQWNRWAMLPWLPCGLEVELRLSRHFYDLAALAPQDAEAYVRMREQAALSEQTRIWDYLEKIKNNW